MPKIESEPVALTEFALAVFVYCSIFDGSVTSWIRSKKRNAALGGVPHSGHVVGLGCDVVYDVVPPEDERRAWAGRLGLLLVIEGDHDHLQPATWRAG